MNEMISEPPVPVLDPSKAADVAISDPKLYFDNEWVKFMSNLSKNDSLRDIVAFIESVHWSRRQKTTLMSYCKIILGDRFSTTNFRYERDYRIFKDYKELVCCDLSAGLTRFDLTAEWNILLGLIDTHFEANINMSKRGWFVKRVGTHSSEILQEEHTRNKEQGIKERIKQGLYGED